VDGVPDAHMAGSPPPIPFLTYADSQALGPVEEQGWYWGNISR